MLAQIVVVLAVSCGVPTGDSSFEAIDGETIGRMNYLGQSGWELVSVLETGMPPLTHRRLYFKRRGEGQHLTPEAVPGGVDLPPVIE